MHTFQINTLIKFFNFLTSACFEPHGFNLRMVRNMKMMSEIELKY